MFAPGVLLFFGIYAQALQGRPGTTALLDGIVDSWLAPVVELLDRLAFPHEHAAAQTRLGVAVTRGLLLDLLATGAGDVDSTASCR